MVNNFKNGVPVTLDKATYLEYATVSEHFTITYLFPLTHGIKKMLPN